MVNEEVYRLNKDILSDWASRGWIDEKTAPYIDNLLDAIETHLSNLGLLKDYFGIKAEVDYNRNIDLKVIKVKTSAPVINFIGYLLDTGSGWILLSLHKKNKFVGLFNLYGYLDDYLKEKGSRFNKEVFIDLLFQFKNWVIEIDDLFIQLWKSGKKQDSIFRVVLDELMSNLDASIPDRPSTPKAMDLVYLIMDAISHFLARLENVFSRFLGLLLPEGMLGIETWWKGFKVVSYEIRDVVLWSRKFLSKILELLNYLILQNRANVDYHLVLESCREQLKLISGIVYPQAYARDSSNDYNFKFKINERGLFAPVWTYPPSWSKDFCQISNLYDLVLDSNEDGICYLDIILNPNSFEVLEKKYKELGFELYEDNKPLIEDYIKKVKEGAISSSFWDNFNRMGSLIAVKDATDMYEKDTYGDPFSRMADGILFGRNIIRRLKKIF
ncbi:MAG: hypothetical protein N2380_03620 [bacterium]|nr:hypothetical protein [bacterium]